MVFRKLHALLKLGVPAIALFVAAPAHAVSVTFSTTGTFTCTACTGSGTNIATFGGGGNLLSLAFTGVPSATVFVNPTSNSSAGQIQSSVSGNGATIPVPATLSLQITQTSPSSQDGTLVGELTGTVMQNGSDGALEFSSTSLVLGGVKYTLAEQSSDANGNMGYDIEPHDTNSGITTLQMRIDATEVPEPTFMTLTGIGFAVLSVVAIRRRRLQHQ